MPRQRYLLAFNAADPMLWVDRYLATGSVEQRTAGLMAARVRGAAAMAQRSQTSDVIRERVAEQAALSRRLAGADLLRPGMWAAESVGAMEAGGAPASFAQLIAASGGATYQTILCADREGALAALARARALTMDQIGALDPGPQADAVVAMWRGFADYFLALGVGARGWAKYRDALAQATGSDNGTGGLVRFLLSDRAGAFPRGYDLLFAERPRGTPASEAEVAAAAAALAAPEPAPPWSQEVIDTAAESGATLPPTASSQVAVSMARSAEVSSIYRRVRSPRAKSWRGEAEARVRALFGAAPAALFFGSKRQVDAAGADVLRLSIREDGYLDLSGFGAPGEFDRLDCVARNGLTGEADGTTGGLPAPRAGFNWMCGAASLDAQGRAYYLGPLVWYAALLRPLLDYLASRDPLEVAAEVQLDVLGKNLWTTIATGRGEAALRGLGAATEIADAAGRRDASRAMMQRFNTASGIMLAAVGAVAPMAAAVGGLAVAGTNLVNELVPPGVVYRSPDALGRPEPVVERFQLEPGLIRDFQCGDVGDARPAGVAPRGGAPYTPWYARTAPPGARQDFSRALSYLTTGTLQRTEVVAPTALPFQVPRVRVLGMPPGWAAWVDGALAAGRWDGGGWSVDVGVPGDHALRLSPPPGSPEPPRVTVVSVPPGGAASVPFGAVPPETVVAAADRVLSGVRPAGAGGGGSGAGAVIAAAAAVAILAGGGVAFALWRRRAAPKRNGPRRRRA